MPSPFPGMNPYLEQEEVWHTFHEQFIPLCQEILVPQVRPAYIVKLDEHLYIHELPTQERQFLGRADVGVAKGTAPVRASSGAAVLDAPAYGRIPAAIDAERQSFVEIRDRKNRQLITVLELLSPTNKRPGPDREQYLAKRRQLLASDVHVMEIDLLRGGGPRMPIEELPACDYYAMVSRAEERPRVGLWPITLHELLPRIRIPLREADAAAEIDLQAMLHRLYDAGGYEDYIYDGTPQPPLSSSDQAWVQTLLRPGG